VLPLFKGFCGDKRQQVLDFLAANLYSRLPFVSLLAGIPL
jgi:hypothetical protein